MAKPSRPTAQFQLSLEDLVPLGEFQQKFRSSVLVIMFTDLEESTSRAERMGEQYAETIRLLHDKIISGIIAQDGRGKIVKNLGDSLMCVFSTPSDAVERAIEIQKAFLEYNSQHGTADPIRVRIGLHMGQAVASHESQQDVFGRHVNRAKRVESLAHPGQILLTYPVYDSAKGLLRSGGERWSYHGEYMLKGIPEPVAIYEVSVDDWWEPRPLSAVPAPSQPSITLALPPRRRSRRKLLALGAAVPAFLLGGWLVWDWFPRDDVVPPPTEPLEDADIKRYDEILQGRVHRIGNLLLALTHSGSYQSCEISPLQRADRFTATTTITVTRKGTMGLRPHSTVFDVTFSKTGVYTLAIQKDDTGIALSLKERDRKKTESALRKELATNR